MSLLSWETSKQLRLIDTVKNVNTGKAKSLESEAVQQLKVEYRDIFTGVGKLKGVKVKLHIDKTVEPVVQKDRRPPFHVRKDIEKQLKRDEHLDIIEHPQWSNSVG